MTDYSTRRALMVNSARARMVGRTPGDMVNLSIDQLHLPGTYAAVVPSLCQLPKDYDSTR